MNDSTNTIADLSEFCGWRSENKPWVEDGKIIATDAVVLLVVEEYSGDLLTGPPPFKDCAAVLDVIPFDSLIWMPLPPMPTCTYKAGRECPDCDSDGEKQCLHCGSYYDCDECNGKGVIGDSKCEFCDSEINIGHRKFRGKYLHRLAKLPGIEIAPESQHHAAMPLRFNGGIGCVADLMRVSK